MEMRHVVLVVATLVCILATSSASSQQPAQSTLAEAERILKELRTPNVPSLQVQFLKEHSPTDRIGATLVANYWRSDWTMESVYVFAFYKDNSLRFVVDLDKNYDKAIATLQTGGVKVATGTWRVREDGTVDITYTTNYTFVRNDTVSYTVKLRENDMTVMYGNDPRPFRAVKK
jgi:ABC-type phosphate/phosphonate transport system substrate-binding protein